MRMNLASCFILRQDLVLVLVCPSHDDVHTHDHDETQHRKRQQYRMALDEARGVGVDLRAEHGETLGEDLGQRPDGPALGVAAAVVAHPGDEERHGRVRATGNEAGPEDLDLYVGDGDEDHVADNGGGQRAHQEDALFIDAIGPGIQYNHGDGGTGVGDDGEELCAD